ELLRFAAVGSVAPCHSVVPGEYEFVDRPARIGDDTTHGRGEPAAVGQPVGDDAVVLLLALGGVEGAEVDGVATARAVGQGDDGAAGRLVQSVGGETIHSSRGHRQNPPAR